jgi:hypothetical protein
MSYDICILMFITNAKLQSLAKRTHNLTTLTKTANNNHTTRRHDSSTFECTLYFSEIHQTIKCRYCSVSYITLGHTKESSLLFMLKRR